MQVPKRAHRLGFRDTTIEEIVEDNHVTRSGFSVEAFKP